MKIADIRNLTAIEILESATELFKSKRYQDKDFVEKFIGLVLHRTGFYGLDGNSTIPLNRSRTRFNEPTDVNLRIEGIVVLKSLPTNEGAGDVVYKGYGLLEVNGLVVYDGRSSGGGGIATWGGILGDINNQTDLINYIENEILTANSSLEDVDIANTTTIVGATVKAALEQLNTDFTFLVNNKENAFLKNTAFNKDFGNSAGTTTEGNDPRLSDARTPTAHGHTSDEVSNESTVVGTTITDALETLLASSGATWGQIVGTLSNQTDLQNALNAKINLILKGAANGIAELDGAGRLPSSQLPTTTMEYKGVWNATTNTTPTLADGIGTNGDYYLVSVAGSTNLDGENEWSIGDTVIFNGTLSVWQKVGRDDLVASVFGRVGIVVAANGDYLASQVTNDSNVTGSTTKDALETLNTGKANTSHTLPSHSDVPTYVFDGKTYFLGSTNGSNVWIEITSTWNGSWVTGTTYAIGDFVVNTDSVYECITANSDAVFTIAKWKLIATKKAEETAYTPLTPSDWATAPTQVAEALDQAWNRASNYKKEFTFKQDATTSNAQLFTGAVRAISEEYFGAPGNTVLTSLTYEVSYTSGVWVAISTIVAGSNDFANLQDLFLTTNAGSQLKIRAVVTLDPSVITRENLVINYKQL